MFTRRALSPAVRFRPARPIGWTLPAGPAAPPPYCIDPVGDYSLLTPRIGW